MPDFTCDKRNGNEGPRDTLLPTSTHLHQVCTHRLGDAMGNRSLPCRWWEHTARTLGRGRCLSIRLSPGPATHANPGPCRHSRVPCCQGYIRRATAAVFVMVKSQPTQEPYRNAASDAPGEQYGAVNWQRGESWQVRGNLRAGRHSGKKPTCRTGCGSKRPVGMCLYLCKETLEGSLRNRAGV